MLPDGNIQSLHPGATRAVEGRVIGLRGPLAGAEVRESGSGAADTTAEDGRFRLDLPEGAAGPLRLRITRPGYLSREVAVGDGGGTRELGDVALAEEAVELQERTVRGSSPLAKLRDGAYSTAVVDARRHEHRGIGAVELLNAAAGVKVRRDGGLGSRADISLQGLSGKRVRFFLDGIPAEYLGLGTGLQGLPLHVLDRVEVYKGAAPIELAGDALGGAVNAVTRKDAGSWFDFAYGHSSFDTHKTSLSLRRALAGGAFVEAHAFRNTSDNDYPVDVYLQDPATYKVDDRPTRVRRFHDGYANQGAQVLFGWNDRPWAEHASGGLVGSGMEKDVQHNLNMEQPYGEVRLSESARGAFLNYRKDLFAKSLSLQVHGAYHRVATAYVDTTRNTYDWTGSVIRVRESGGEVAFDRGNHVDLETRTALGRAGVVWSLEPGWRLAFHDLLAWRDRDGRDRLTADPADRDPLTLPNLLVRNASGLSLEKELAGGATTLQASLKHHAFRAEGHGRSAAEWVPATADGARLGAGLAARTRLGAGFLLRGSYERTARMPDESELFGYFREVQPNMALTPEVSHTLNAGIRYRGRRLTAEMGAFYRLVDDLIHMRVGSFWARHENLLKARYAGVEGDMRWRPAPFLDLEANATYQDIRNRSEPGRSGATDARYHDARVPNIPFLFGNLSARLSGDGLGASHARLSAFWTGHYVHEFYLYWAQDGRADTKAVIPSQFLQDAGLTYSLFQNRVNLTAEVLNLADVPAYDHFRIRKPGRAFGVKVHTFLGGGER
jgi:outer membrane receptor protein involved in Fe transport